MFYFFICFQNKLIINLNIEYTAFGIEPTVEVFDIVFIVFIDDVGVVVNCDNCCSVVDSCFEYKIKIPTVTIINNNIINMAFFVNNIFLICSILLGFSCTTFSDIIYIYNLDNK
jgi:hypothetical protein